MEVFSKRASNGSHETHGTHGRHGRHWLLSCNYYTTFNSVIVWISAHDLNSQEVFSLYTQWKSMKCSKQMSNTEHLELSEHWRRDSARNCDCVGMWCQVMPSDGMWCDVSPFVGIDSNTTLLNGNWYQWSNEPINARFRCVSF